MNPIRKIAQAINAIRSGKAKPPAGSLLGKLATAVSGGSDWYATRQQGKPVRRAYTDRLQVDVGNDSESYRSATNEVYRAAIGLTADEVRSSRKPKEGTDPEIARNYLTVAELRRVQEAERQIAALPK